MLTFEETDICKVKNHANKPLKLTWSNRDYVVPPGQEKVIPVYAAILAFGDPRSIQNIRSWKNPATNVVGWIPDRASEVRRLRLRYAIQDGFDGTLTNAKGEVPETVPDVTVWFMDGGDWVQLETVIDDPTGNNALLENDQTIDIQTLQASLEKTQRQLAMLMQQQSGDIGLGPEEDIPVDDPHAAVAGAKKGK